MPTGLFGLVGNRARSQMAEGLFNAAPPPGWRARSAGTEPGPRVSDAAIALMREVGIDISGGRPKGLADAMGPDVQLIVGLCAEEACPVIPGVRALHWPLPDPRERDLIQFRQIRDDLRTRIAQLVSDLTRGAEGTPPKRDR